MSDQPQPSAVWTEVNELFHQALDLPPAERRAFLDKHASTRPDVQRQVLSLLASHERTGTFLEGRAADSGVLDRDADPLVGQRLGHYQIERVLGRGGMGIVYLARDTKLGRTVALKSLPSEFADDPRRRERLSHEARAAAGLTDPGIATVYALEEIDGRLFIASEHVVGHTLRDELSGGPMSPADAMATGAGIARALAAAHRRGVVHRDLKPENVMRTETGTIKILDFGLARALTASTGALTATSEGRIFGTPAYMAPEQVRNNEVRFSVDQFSFGVLLYELLTGTNPFAGPDAAASIARILELTPPSILDRIPAGFAHASGVTALASVVERCLQKDPSQRFASTADLVAAIEAAELGTSRRGDHAVWWWRFHQGLACTFYACLLFPLWFADERVGGSAGIALFVIALVAAIVTITLRLHLWFVTRSYPQQWAAQRRQAIGWKRAADLLYVAAFAISGLALLGVARPLALVLVGAAVLIFLASAFIEPATERAAFGSDQLRPAVSRFAGPLRIPVCAEIFPVQPDRPGRHRLSARDPVDPDAARRRLSCSQLRRHRADGRAQLRLALGVDLGRSDAARAACDRLRPLLHGERAGLPDEQPRAHAARRGQARPAGGPVQPHRDRRRRSPQLRPRGPCRVSRGAGIIRGCRPRPSSARCVTTC